MSNEEVSSSEGVLLKELPDQSGEQIHSNKTRESSLVIDESHLNDSTTRIPTGRPAERRSGPPSLQAG